MNNAVDLSCRFQTTCRFKSVRSPSQEQSVPTCMNRPDNNTVQAGQLNHVQACQQAKTSIAFVRVDGFLNMNLNINFQT